eukprot:1438352-Rhodomonas_salina.2
MSGHCATRCPVLTHAICYQTTCHAAKSTSVVRTMCYVLCAIGLRVCYAMSGTDTACGAMVLRACYAMCGAFCYCTTTGYLATPRTAAFSGSGSGGHVMKRESRADAMSGIDVRNVRTTASGSGGHVMKRDVTVNDGRDIDTSKPLAKNLRK